MNRSSFVTSVLEAGSFVKGAWLWCEEEADHSAVPVFSRPCLFCKEEREPLFGIEQASWRFPGVSRGQPQIACSRQSPVFFSETWPVKKGTASWHSAVDGQGKAKTGTLPAQWLTRRRVSPMCRRPSEGSRLFKNGAPASRMADCLQFQWDTLH